MALGPSGDRYGLVPILSNVGSGFRRVPNGEILPGDRTDQTEVRLKEWGRPRKRFAPPPSAGFA